MERAFSNATGLENSSWSPERRAYCGFIPLSEKETARTDQGALKESHMQWNRQLVGERYSPGKATSLHISGGIRATDIATKYRHSKQPSQQIGDRVRAE